MSADPKLAELRPTFRVQVSAILDALTARGYQPKISNAYRTAEEQLKKVAQGAAMPGATSPGAHGWGLACDIIDRRWGWTVNDANAGFFADLTDLALAAGMITGGAWFGQKGTRVHPTHPSIWNRWGIGWDPAHIEMRNPPEELRRDYPPEAR